ncbi:MAG: preprotein translocase subunit YajC [Candidatus Acidiferrum sp.]
MPASAGLPALAGWFSSADGSPWRKKGEMIVTAVGIFFLGRLALWAQAPQASGLPFIISMGAIFVLMYLLLIMPAQRRQKKVSEMLRNLKNGDKVVTNGGIYGTIVGLDDDSIQLRVADQVKIKVSRNAIAGLQLEKKES